MVACTAAFLVVLAAEPGSAAFPWHPVMMTLSFCVFMPAGLLSYFAGSIQGTERAESRAWHVIFMALAGVCIAGFYEGTGKVGLMISSYVGMGWACVICSKEIYERMSPRPMGLFYLVAGGILYTAGVPFVIRDKRTLGLPDHTIWHLFVIGGSLCHYMCVFYYLVSFPYFDDGQIL